MKKRIFQTLPFRVKVVIANGQISKEALLQLEEGDVLLFDQKIDSSLSIFVENQPIFKGNPGYFKGFKAVKVE